MSTSTFNAVHQELSMRWQRREQEAALLHSSGTLYWGDLDRAANRLAHRLLSVGITAESRVGVSLPRSPAMIVALLAVLRAGGAFVPLDPGYPASRLAHMCSDAGVTCVITHSTLQATFAPSAVLPCLYIDDDSADVPETDPAVAIHPNQLAYLIYTSGSTGTPKGVAVEHGPLAAHCAAIGARYQMTDRDRVLHFASINFDLAHEYWLMPLLHGASLLITDPDLWSPDIACTRLREHRVTVAAFPPGYLNQLAQWLESTQQTLPLRVCAFGGEAMARDSFARICRTIPAEQWINGYGPTETVISPMLWQITPEHDPASWQDSAYLPIGTAVGQRAVHILDDYLNPVPPGVSGEIYLSGYELARGYHQRPGLSAERFLPHANGSRLYRTGDLGRWRSDGSVAYLGRQDHQIKLRGLRIEPGEIETVLLSHPDVREAVVLPWRNGSETRLIGYIGTTLDNTTGVTILKAHLAARLPDYMSPAQLILLTQLPRTANGKVAQQALPEPVWESAAYRAPRSGLECTLAAIWQQVLGVAQVGLDDNFFVLGGHSLLATQIVARLQREIGLTVPLRILFEAPALGDYTLRIEQIGQLQPVSNAAPASRPQRIARHDATMPLSPAQQGLWFMSKLEPASAAYAIPCALRLQGTLDEVALAGSLDRLVARHDVLRMRFATTGDTLPRAHFAAVDTVAIERIDLTALPSLREREMRAQALVQAEALRPFGLEQGPPMRCMLLKIAADDHLLLLTVHHIVADGWSVGILLNELPQLYAACRDDLPDPLPAAALSYADVAVWSSRELDTAAAQQRFAGWHARFAQRPVATTYPPDRHTLPEATVATRHGKRLPFSFHAADIAALRAYAASQGASLSMALQAILHALLYRHLGATEQCIGMPVSHRPHVEMEQIVGLFVHTQILQVAPVPGQSYHALLQQVRDTALAAQEVADYPFDLLARVVNPARIPGHFPFTGVLYNFIRVPQASDDKCWPGLTVADYPVERELVIFDLEMDLVERADGSVTGAFSYRTDLYQMKTIARLCRHMVQLTTAFAADPLQTLDAPTLAGAPAADASAVSTPALPNSVTQLSMPVPLIQSSLAAQAIEEQLRTIWQRLLNVTEIGVNDNFFDLGGHSLLCVRMVDIAHHYGLALTLRQCLQHQTIASLASALTAPLAGVHPDKELQC